MPVTTEVDAKSGIVRHTVVTPFDLAEAVTAATVARDIVLSRSAGDGPVLLLLDFRAMRSPEFAAHRAWRQGFLDDPAAVTNIARTAILGADTPQVRAEQAAMESATVRFFFDEESAIDWLLGSRRPEIT